MGREGIRFVSRLSEETGINRRTLTLLLEDRMLRFDADVLARLCAYFNCQPGDLLTFVPTPDRPAVVERDASGSGRDASEVPLA